MRKPKVAILHYSCPPVIGGVEFIIEAHARLLQEAGYQTRLVVGEGDSLYEGITTEVIPEMSSQGGLFAGILEALNAGRVPAAFAKAVIRMERKLVSALKGTDLCIMHNVLTMHFNLILTAALASLMHKGGRRRYIGWIHDATFVDPSYREHQRRKYPWTLLTRPLRGCDYCVISTQRQRELRRLFGTPGVSLPVIADGIYIRDLLGLTPMVTDLFREEELYHKDIVALTPTRIVRRKNLETGIRIISALKKQRCSVRWIVTGAPDPHNQDSVQYFSELTALRERYRVQDEVIFMCQRAERVSSEDLRGLYGVSNILLFPSAREGFGMPVLEAGIAGLLVVISDIPALRELGGHDTVYIYPGMSSESVAHQILDSFSRSPGLMFRRRILADYSWDAIFADKILPAVTEPEKVWRKPAGRPARRRPTR